MSHCGDLCLPSGWEGCSPQPLTSTELCVTSCQDSKAIIYPPPVVLTLPGPVLSSCPQESVVGSRSPPVPGRSWGSGAPLGYWGYGNAAGLRGSLLFGGAWNCSRSYNSGGSSVGRGNCGPFLHRQFSSCSRGSFGPW